MFSLIYSSCKTFLQLTISILAFRHSYLQSYLYKKEKTITWFRVCFGSKIIISGFFFNSFDTDRDFEDHGDFQPSSRYIDNTQESHRNSYEPEPGSLAHSFLVSKRSETSRQSPTDQFGDYSEESKKRLQSHVAGYNHIE